jgi:hypothetical protein
MERYSKTRRINLKFEARNNYVIIKSEDVKKGGLIIAEENKTLSFGRVVSGDTEGALVAFLKEKSIDMGHMKKDHVVVKSEHILFVVKE